MASVHLLIYLGMCVCTLNIATLLVVKLRQDTRSTYVVKEEPQIATIYIITPTYSRHTQKADLTSLCYTLLHVPRLVWIVVEDSRVKTPLVSNLLNRCRVQSVHLVQYSAQLNATRGRVIPSLLKGVDQRNAGLRWIRDPERRRNSSEVVYFGDDDNTYDVRLFEEIRKTETVSVFTVAFSGGLIMEGPTCRNGRAAKWHMAWAPERELPVDMAGFSINVRLLLERMNVWMGVAANGTVARPGFIETEFFSQFTSREAVECRSNDDEVLVWHTKTERPFLVYEDRHPSDPTVEY